MSSLRLMLMGSHLDVECSVLALKRVMLRKFPDPESISLTLETIERVEIDLVEHFSVQQRLFGLADRTFGGELDEAHDLIELRVELLHALDVVRGSVRESNETAAKAGFRSLEAAFDRCTDLEWEFITRYGTIIFPALCGGG